MPKNVLQAFNALVQGVVKMSRPAALSADAESEPVLTCCGYQVVHPYSVPEASFQSSGTLTTTTSTALKAAAGAGIRNCLVGLQYQNTNATATTVNVLDGATVIARFNAPASMAVPAIVQFDIPLRGSANTALNIQCGTTAASVLYNAQGYETP